MQDDEFSDFTFCRPEELELLQRQMEQLRLENDRLQNVVVVLQCQLAQQRSENELLTRNSDQLARQLLASERNREEIRSAGGSAISLQKVKSSSIFKLDAPRLSKEELQEALKELTPQQLEGKTLLKYMLKQSSESVLAQKRQSDASSNRQGKLLTLKQIRNMSMQGAELLMPKSTLDNQQNTQHKTPKHPAETRRSSYFKKPQVG